MNTLCRLKVGKIFFIPLFELRDDDDIWEMIVDEGRDGVSSVSFVSDK